MTDMVPDARKDIESFWTNVATTIGVNDLKGIIKENPHGGMFTAATNKGATLIKLTPETILATRKFYVDNAQECIDEVLDGLVQVNDTAKYIKDMQKRKLQALNGEFDGTLAFRQKAVYIQTGEEFPLMGG
jgi:hypothetical protein